MKKAQWKQDPRERAFGKDPREVLNDNLTKALHEANEKIAVLKETLRRDQELIDQQRASLSDRSKRERAYTWLRAKGVVVEDEGEFKHLQGSDMDAFFKITEGRKVTMTTALGAGFFGSSVVAPSIVQAQVEKLLSDEFNNAFKEYMWQALPK